MKNYFINFKNLLIGIIITGFIYNQPNCMAQNLLLFNGETSNIDSCIFDFGNADSTQPYSGQWCFKATPDYWHSPSINLSCQNRWRSDVSMYDEIWFYAKSNVAGKTFRFNVSGWPYTSRQIDISPYIAGGALDTTYKLVRIPIDSLNTPQYTLQGVEMLYFDTSGTPNFIIYIDQIVAMDLKGIKADTIYTLSNQTIKISVSDRYDTTSAKTLSNYDISSAEDTNFTVVKNPIKLGMQYYVHKFADNGPYPTLNNELFLSINEKMKNGKTYTLTIHNIRDRAGNDFPLDQKFSFTFNDLTDINHSVKVNQVGYLPISPKFGYIGNYLGSGGAMECNPATYELRDASSNQIIYTDTPDFKAYDTILSGEKVYECDFTDFQTPGRYYIYVPGIGRSYPFTIDSTVYDSVFYTTARALYYQRCGMALTTPYADPRFVRGACHLSPGIIHTSCTSTPLYNGESIGSSIPMTGGWHDAGDFGRYIPSASTVLYDLFIAYEMFPQKYWDSELNIPESGNGVPDILDEAKWEINWFKEMQAPDGGVYFKVNTTAWGTTMPEFDLDPLYLAQKTTFSTGHFAAIMAMAYRNLKPFWPDYADTCLARSERAWNFLLAHPTEDPVGGWTVNPPGIGGGEYVDPDGDTDERAWVTAELYKSTGKPIYDSLFTIYWAGHQPIWGFNSFQHHQRNASFAYATTKFPTDSNKVNSYKQAVFEEIRTLLIPQCDSNHYKNSYRSDFAPFIGWGSFAQSTRYSRDFILAYYFSGDTKYLDYAKINLNTQLGANPQDISYITGVGSNYPRDPLHGPSIRDGIDEPVPGISVEGPICHMSFSDGFDYETLRKENLYPKGEQENDPYPILRRFFDLHNNVETNEFDVDVLGFVSTTFAFFKSGTAPIITQNDKPVFSNSGFQLTSFPNPSTHTTTISFMLTNPDKITLKIYDVYGRQIVTLLDDKLTTGLHSVNFDINNLFTGMYYCELKNTSAKEVKKIMKF